MTRAFSPTAYRAMAVGGLTLSLAMGAVAPANAATPSGFVRSYKVTLKPKGNPPVLATIKSKYGKDIYINYTSKAPKGLLKVQAFKGIPALPLGEPVILKLKGMRYKLNALPVRPGTTIFVKWTPSSAGTVKGKLFS
jgi:hypothetical protein